MPWKETCAMDQRVQFIADWLSGNYTKTSLCEAYGISRPTGYKWIKRYELLGVKGLKERSKAPFTHPNQIPDVICQRIADTKLAHQSWGPKKVMDLLRALDPQGHECSWHSFGIPTLPGGQMWVIHAYWIPACTVMKTCYSIILR
jgi:hypothetical protein